MKLAKTFISLLLLTLLTNSTFAKVSSDRKESKEITYSARKLGLKTGVGTKVYAKLHKPLQSLPNGLKVKKDKRRC